MCDHTHVIREDCHWLCPKCFQKFEPVETEENWQEELKEQIVESEECGAEGTTGYCIRHGKGASPVCAYTFDCLQAPDFTRRSIHSGDYEDCPLCREYRKSL